MIPHQGLYHCIPSGMYDSALSLSALSESNNVPAHLEIFIDTFGLHGPGCFGLEVSSDLSPYPCEYMAENPLV